MCLDKLHNLRESHAQTLGASDSFIMQLKSSARASSPRVFQFSRAPWDNMVWSEKNAERVRDASVYLFVYIILD